MNTTTPTPAGMAGRSALLLLALAADIAWWRVGENDPGPANGATNTVTVEPPLP